MKRLRTIFVESKPNKVIFADDVLLKKDTLFFYKTEEKKKLLIMKIRLKTKYTDVKKALEDLGFQWSAY